MKLIDLRINEFINEVDSNSPAPGGGSVSALISSLGVSLARMVGHLSVSKKKFRNLDQEIQDEFNNHLDHLLVIKDELSSLIDKDTEAFNKIMSAFQIPKEEADIRKRAIEAATLEAIKVPYKVSTISFKALEMLSYILAYGNKQTVSDLGVAALSLATGIEGASLNVLINLPGLSDEEQINMYKTEMKALLKETQLLKQNILNLVYEQL
ncbi:MAG: cyclodeaminase/cyclohydrolase family protein [Acholeplasmataceae bacterium]